MVIPSSTNFVQLSRISRAFTEGEHRQQVLNDVTVGMARGETVALLGRSGSGKSTLLNLISGIDVADQGNVVVDGIELTRLSEKERTLFRRQHIGFIYQFFNLVPGLTAAENIAFVLELNDFPPTFVKERTRLLLEQIELADKADKFPSQLSGGEQQRIAIARALAHSPKVVLADEPTGNLDARTGQLMLDVLRNLLSENNSTLLLVTHSLAVAKTADRILTLESGVIAEQGDDFAW